MEYQKGNFNTLIDKIHWKHQKKKKLADCTKTCQ